VDVVVPVPLHRWRLVRRGFNQALVLARPLCREHGLACRPEILVRRRYTRPQVGLDQASRRRNVAGAFMAPPRHGRLLDQATVLLVDDVYTTGATLRECARTLLNAGAARVHALTLVRAGGPATQD
jgi:ComF family protein